MSLEERCNRVRVPSKEKVVVRPVVVIKVVCKVGVWFVSEAEAGVALVRFLEYLKDIPLPGPVLARDLKAATVHKIQNYAVRQLLDLHLRRVWSLEVAHVISLDSARLVISVLALDRQRYGRRPLDSAEDQKPLAVKANGTPLPQEVVRELDVNVAHVGHNARRIASAVLRYGPVCGFDLAVFLLGHSRGD